MHHDAVKNTVKQFEDFTALDSVNLEIPKGTAFGLLGSNGAGKSTILRLFSGIYRAESGEVLIDGELFMIMSMPSRKYFSSMMKLFSSADIRSDS